MTFVLGRLLRLGHSRFFMLCTNAQNRQSTMKQRMYNLSLIHIYALKFPNVPITESELLIVIMIGGSKNLSVICTIALSNAVAMSWLNEIIIYLLCYG